ncbi:DUF1493 family protein [Mucilaginibacter terrae]|uniref:DUF1493 family protein n=1 Tax=Mucilaginibacter terrae TaxID=1955052 RepID=A0ABU3GV18_9SPHI|nr:DUF1493 family protein [Mucilaginibacter terrae]MDT3403622.1 hypothetical protein [Mucilaginibacter terrae]
MEIPQYKAISFAQLRQAHQKVKHFLEDESFDQVTSLQTKIGDGLGLAGDDVEDLLVKFVQDNKLNWGSFRFDEHFHSEGELFSSSLAMGNLTRFIINLPIMLFNLITFNRSAISTLAYLEIDREVTDLTFRQMLTWYIEKDFTGIDSIRYKLKIAA